MRILVIEDDPNKEGQLLSFCRDCFVGAEVVARRSYQSGLKEAVANPPDLVLLDMSLPNYDVSSSGRGGKMKAFAGKEILRELVRRQIDTRVVVVTQFEAFYEKDERVSLSQLRQTLDREFPTHYVTTVFYDASGSAWKDELARAAGKLCGGDR